MALMLTISTSQLRHAIIDDYTILKLEKPINEHTELNKPFSALPATHCGPYYLISGSHDVRFLHSGRNA